MLCITPSAVSSSFPFTSLVFIVKCIVPRALLPAIHQDHTPRQHPGPVHLPLNIVLRRFIVRLSFFLANHFRFTVPGAYQFPIHTRIFQTLSMP